ncbi:MAG: 4-alpha-glucanotransferase [Dehalococcoidia bacterium]|nr:4-alpha-glucanotransferase [Dehalococcoidia bacterium]
MPARERLLRSTAHLYGVQTVYYGYGRRRQSAQTESLLAVLKSLGAPLTTLAESRSAYRESRLAQLQKSVEPVVIAWNGNLPFVEVRLPQSLASVELTGVLTMEDGSHRELKWHDDLPTGRQLKFEGLVWREKQLPLAEKLPPGYHRLTINIAGREGTTLIISAPVRAYSPREKKSWGVFMPLYSLHSQRGWGSGSFTDLANLAGWMGEQGGSAVSSLPLLATYLDRPFEPSPYLPLSKLLWNEFFIDITSVPELTDCQTAQSLINSPGFQAELQSLRRTRLVDYRRGMALKRQALEELSRYFFAVETPRRQEYERFLREHPELEDYARFRAVMEKQGKTWRKWSRQLQAGGIAGSDFDEHARNYHLYAQWLAHEQLASSARTARAQKVRLYLDLPLGVHGDGFDTWRYRDIFVNGISAGAPPDVVFTGGQNWAFPPVHPERVRETGYAYTIACIRHHLQYAKILRLDHIMGLHRLFVIPHGMEGKHGVYLRYRPEEVYAILSLESHRHQSIIVGEDLGIVPLEVRTAMRRHNLRRMYVMYYELASNAYPLLPTPPTNAVASYNTHDMPPFGSFWSGQDIQDRLDTGIITEAEVRGEQDIRAVVRGRLLAFLKGKGLLKTPATVTEILRACLAFITTSRARLVMVNLEDLWLETRTQNIPSTTTEHPNWRRKAQYKFEDFCKMRRVLVILKEIHSARKGRAKPSDTGGKA